MPEVLCLLYHRVHPIEDSLYHLTVSPEHFESHIRYISRRYPVLRFEEEWEGQEKNAVVITFDDGYADNYQYALPILEKYQIPATVFVTSGMIGEREEFWWDELGRLLLTGNAYPETFSLRDSLYAYTWETDTEKKRADLAVTLRWLLRMEPDIERRRDWFLQLSEWGGITPGARQENLALSRGQFSKMAESGLVTLGAHTCTHRSLGALSVARQREEIEGSVLALRKLLQKEVTVFSYPFGLKMDYGPDTEKLCMDCGIKKAATTEQKLWTPECGAYRIPRRTVRDWTEEEFAEKMVEFWNE